jgi:hypothetical protein
VVISPLEPGCFSEWSCWFKKLRSVRQSRLAATWKKACEVDAEVVRVAMSGELEANYST